MANKPTQRCPKDFSACREFPLEVPHYLTRLRLIAPSNNQGWLMTRIWKSTFCSMDPRENEDHRRLFKLLDRISTNRRESDLDETNALLDELLEYTFDHFSREEKAMAACAYPSSVQHAKEHVAMRQAFIESLRKVTKGSMTIPDFVRHLKESFIYHFERDDMIWVCWQQHQGKEQDLVAMDRLDALAMTDPWENLEPPAGIELATSRLQSCFRPFGPLGEQGG